MNINYQNYLHYKLPITMNPLEFGNVIEVINNKYIVQLHTNNVAVIKPLNEDNFVRLYKKGELMFEFKDSKISEDTFTRTILDNKFTFKNGKLISTEIINVGSSVLIYNYDESLVITPLNFQTKNIFRFVGDSDPISVNEIKLFILKMLLIILSLISLFYVIFHNDSNTI